MLGANHTACRKGKKVWIELRNGEKFVDVFIERKGGTIFLKNRGRIGKKDLKKFAIYRKRH